MTSKKQTLSSKLKQEFEQRAMESIKAELLQKADQRKREREAGDTARAALLQKLDVASMPKPARLEPPKLDLSPKKTDSPMRGSGPMLLAAADRRIYRPPYQALELFTQKHCGGQPDQCAVIADHAAGTMTMGLHIVNNSADCWAFGAVGLWYTPNIKLPLIFEFNPCLRWSYNYTLQAGWTGQTAHSTGEVGARIFSFSSSSMAQQTNGRPLWQYGVGVQPIHSDSDSGVGFFNSPVPYDPSRWYLCCSYIYATCDGGGWPEGQATVDFFGTMPFCMISEWGLN